MPSSGSLLSIVRLCEEAALPSANRHLRADALLQALDAMAATGKNPLLAQLDRGLTEHPRAHDLRGAIVAAMAVDALADRRPVSAIERERVDDFVARVSAREDIDADKRALALAARGRIRLLVGRGELALADLKRAYDLTQPTSVPQVVAYVSARYGYALMMMARLEESLEMHERASALARQCEDARVYISSLQDQGNLFQQLGRVDEARAMFDRSRETATEVGDTAGEMRAHAGIAFGHLDAGRFEPSRDAYAMAVAIGERDPTASPRLHALVLGYSAVLHLEHERFDRAVALSARAVASSARLGFRLGEGFFAAVQAAAHARRGDLASADDRIRFARGRVPAEHKYVHVVRLYDAMVEVEHKSRNNLHHARAVLEELSQPKALAEVLDDARVAARILRKRLETMEQEASAPEVAPPSEETAALTSRLDARRMLSYLRVQNGKPISALDLARYVWPDEAESEESPTAATARARLDVLIKASAEERFHEAIVDGPEGYWLEKKPRPTS